MLLSTKRLVLRPVLADDAEEIYEYCRNPLVGLRAGWKPHESLEETREIMRAVFLDKEGVWAIVRRDPRKLIGTIGLTGDTRRQNVPGVRMLGYATGEPYWGQGYATEAVHAALDYAFSQLRLALVSATCYPQNTPSHRVLEKGGFVYEGMLHRAERLYTGDMMDICCYIATPESVAAARRGGA